MCWDDVSEYADNRLQEACRNIIFMDVPPSGNTGLQCQGRFHGVGRRQEVRFWLLMVDHTYVQVIQ